MHDAFWRNIESIIMKFTIVNNKCGFSQNTCTYALWHSTQAPRGLWHSLHAGFWSNLHSWTTSLIRTTNPKMSTKMLLNPKDPLLECPLCARYHINSYHSKLHYLSHNQRNPWPERYKCRKSVHNAFLKKFPTLIKAKSYYFVQCMKEPNFPQTISL